MKKKWNIGDMVKDEDGNMGIVCIEWNDGEKSLTRSLKINMVSMS